MPKRGRLGQFLSTTAQFKGLQQRFLGVPVTTFHDMADLLKEDAEVQAYVGTAGDEPPYAATAEAIRKYWLKQGIQPKSKDDMKRK